MADSDVADTDTQQEVPQGDEQAEGAEQPQQRFLDRDEAPEEEVSHPTKLLRIAHSIRSMLDEVQTTELDEAGRKRLADIHNRCIESLKGILSEDLSEELSEDVRMLHDDTPSGPELRVAQAQLAGWLEGLFRGIQASMATQQMAAQKQLQQMKQQRAIEGGRGGGEEGGTGQYL